MNGLGKEFLSNAAFAVNQYVIRTGSKGHCQLFCLHHRTAASNNIVKGIPCRKSQRVLHLLDLRRPRSRNFRYATDFPCFVKQRIHIVGRQHIIIGSVKRHHLNLPVDDRFAVSQNIFCLEVLTVSFCCNKLYTDILHNILYQPAIGFFTILQMHIAAKIGVCIYHPQVFIADMNRIWQRVQTLKDKFSNPFITYKQCHQFRKTLFKRVKLFFLLTVRFCHNHKVGRLLFEKALLLWSLCALGEPGQNSAVPAAKNHIFFG